MGSRSIVYVGIYALIYPHTILSDESVSRDGLPRGVLPSGILKIEKYCLGLKVPVSKFRSSKKEEFSSKEINKVDGREWKGWVLSLQPDHQVFLELVAKEKGYFTRKVLTKLPILMLTIRDPGNKFLVICQFTYRQDGDF